MIKKFWIVVVFFLLANGLVAQVIDSTKTDSTHTPEIKAPAASDTSHVSSSPVSDQPAIKDSTVKKTEEPVPAATEVIETTPVEPIKEVPAPIAYPDDQLIFKPTIGLGVGMFSFFGDLYAKNFQHPMTSRIGYDLQISQKLNNSFNLNFYVLFGKLGANERQTQRNLNFESQIRLGGVTLQYNFNDFIKNKKAAFNPYVLLGFEGFEFLSKTDLYDKNGNRYYYWNDGSIRNMDQNAANAQTNAIKLVRDYTYESDVRESSPDKFGKYPERSWAIPFGAGITLHLNKEMDFRLGTTLHYTFTDYIDGISNKSIGSRKGNARNDMFLMTSFSLTYSLEKVQDDDFADTLDEHYFDNIDYLAVDHGDYDHDNILDIDDDCALTPDDVAVESGGCPVDTDMDGVPDYLDKEEATAKGNLVNAIGVTLTDSIMKLEYLQYNDSTGEYAQKVIRTTEDNGAPVDENYYYKTYSISIGNFKKGLSVDTITQFLSIQDMHTYTNDDSTIFYLAGSYSSYTDAFRRQQLLMKEGYKETEIVYVKEGKLAVAEKLFVHAGERPKKKVKTKTETIASKDDSKQTNVSDTNKNKIDSLNNKQALPPDTTSVALTNDSAGKHNTTILPPDTASSTLVNAEKKNTNPVVTTNTNAGKEEEEEEEAEMPKPNQVIFRVQLGVYKKPLSKNIFKDVPGVVAIKTSDGMYRYISGSYTTFEEAAKQRIELYTKGFREAFVTAYQNGKRVSNTIKGGAAPVNPAIKENLEEPVAPMSTIDRSLIVFKVQLGIFKYDPPEDAKAKFDAVKNLKKEKTTTGLDRYVYGETNDYTEILKMKNEMVDKYGVSDAFIIAFFNNQYISLQEALELMK